MSAGLHPPLRQNLPLTFIPSQDTPTQPRNQHVSYSINSKSKISSKFHSEVPILSSKSSKSGTGETGCNQSILGQNSSPPVKLESAFSGPGIHGGGPPYSNEDMLLFKKRNGRERALVPCNSEIQAGRLERFQVPEFTLGFSAHLWACTSAQSHPSSVCRAARVWIVLSACFLRAKVGTLGALFYFFLSLSHLVQTGTVAAGIRFLKGCGTTVYSHTDSLIRQEPPPWSCPDNPTSIFGFSLETEGISESHPWWVWLRVLFVSEYSDL